ncbi:MULTISPECIES: PRC-barrel domain-containing protein [unclassified Modestobacter]
MTATDTPANLVPLGDTDRTVADPAADVRGRPAFDHSGEEIGTVEDILVDDEEYRARFLQIGSGGFLGIGKDQFLVPVDAVESVRPDRVQVDRDRARMTDAPGYDPEVTYGPSYYEDVYGWWGYGPYWGPGYVYPGYPQL